MSVSQEIMEQAEKEAKPIFDKAEEECEALYQKYRAEGHRGLDGHNAEYKAINHKAFEEVQLVKKKYGIA